MNREDAIRLFDDLNNPRDIALRSEIVLRSPPDAGTENDYVVEIRWDKSKLSELADLLDWALRRPSDRIRSYDGEVRLQGEGDDIGLWLVVTTNTNTSTAEQRAS